MQRREKRKRVSEIEKGGERERKKDGKKEIERERKITSNDFSQVLSSKKAFIFKLKTLK